MTLAFSDAVQYSPVRQYQSTIVPGLFQCIIPFLASIVGSLREHGELLIHVAIQEGQQRNDRQHYIRDKRSHDFREGISNTVSRCVSPRYPGRQSGNSTNLTSNRGPLQAHYPSLRS